MDGCGQTKERKRQYAALRRQIVKEASPALLAKFNLCSDGERLLVKYRWVTQHDLTTSFHSSHSRFGMLKQWIQNPDLGEMEVEEKYKSWIESLRTDRYVTVQTSTDLTDLSTSFMSMENLHMFF